MNLVPRQLFESLEGVAPVNFPGREHILGQHFVRVVGLEESLELPPVEEILDVGAQRRQRQYIGAAYIVCPDLCRCVHAQAVHECDALRRVQVLVELLAHYRAQVLGREPLRVLLKQEFVDVFVALLSTPPEYDPEGQYGLFDLVEKPLCGRGIAGSLLVLRRHVLRRRLRLGRQPSRLPARWTRCDLPHFVHQGLGVRLCCQYRHRAPCQRMRLTSSWCVRGLLHVSRCSLACWRWPDGWRGDRGCCRDASS
mmetsp:Transcript_79593/g.128973  ORF Transcript_79593/g.128973 Transcript_79593/m.128973 type:complete len:253 (-) Transcript_79593:231-989(-)